MTVDEVKGILYDSRVKTDLFRWDYLQREYTSKFTHSDLKFTSDPYEWRMHETFGGKTTLDYVRNKVSLDRKTVTDLYSMIGLSNLKYGDSVILTEGVSDYFTAYLTLGSYLDVIGFTKLGGSELSRVFVKSSYKNVFIMADSDEVGLNNALRLKQYFAPSSYIVSVNPAKDLTAYILDSNYA